MWARQKGFTIVELLIVIVVIGILATITMVAYGGLSAKSYDASVKNDLVSFAKKIESVRVETGSYPATLTAAMGFKFSKSAYGEDFQNRNLRYCYNSTTDSYALLANSKSGNYFKAVNMAISPNPATYGWGVCDLIGISSTNPAQNGYYASGSPQWEAWTN